MNMIHKAVGVSAAAIIVCAVMTPRFLHAIEVARTGYGINADLLNRTAGGLLAFNLNGETVSVGQVEGGRPGDPDPLGPLPGMAPAELAHTNVNPGAAAVLGGVGVAQVINGGALVTGAIQPSPITRDVNLSDHATQVAGVMISSHATDTGIAPKATLFSATYVSTGNGTQDEAIVATNWVVTPPPNPPVRIVNYSYGKFLNDGTFNGAGMPTSTDEYLGTGAKLDGNNLLSLYVDYNASQRDILTVISGNEDTLNQATLPGTFGRPIVVPTDAFNALVVGATSQRASGKSVRFDQVSTGNTIGGQRGAPGQGGPMQPGQPLPGDLNYGSRTNTDIVAPGFSNQEMDIFQPGTNTVVRRVRVFPPVLGPGESATNAGGNVVIRNLANSSRMNMPTLIDTNGSGGLGLGDATNSFARSNGTSFSAPLVTATLGLMKQQSPNANHLDLKAAILNSASKHVMSKIANDPLPGGGDAVDRFDGKAWPVRYLERNPNPFSITTSKDNEMGVGQLNALAAVKQLQGGRADLGASQNIVDPMSSVETVPLGAGEPVLKRGSLITATIAWDREVTNTASLTTLANYGPATSPMNPQPPAPVDLDLELLKVGSATPVARVRSSRDNVEHLYFNVREDGQYFLRVRNFDATRSATSSLSVSVGSTDGMTFSVDGGSFNTARANANPAEGRNAPFNGAPYPNDVNSLGTAGPGFFPTEGELFTSGRDGRNMMRISGALGTRSRVGPFNGPPAAMTMLDSANTQRGVLGLLPNDNLSGISFGKDGSGFNDLSTIVFSVDTAARGAAGSAVRTQAVDSPAGAAVPANTPLPFNLGGGALGGGHEAAGDVFVSPVLGHFGRYDSQRLSPAAPNSNRLLVDESQIGLHAGRGELLGGMEDDLDALEMDSVLSHVDPDGDGMNSQPIFFTLDRTSPSLGGARNSNDIFMAVGKDPDGFAWNDTPSSMFDFQVFADGALNIGLQPEDALDALAVSDVGFEGNPDGPDGFLSVFDEALFSLAPNSPSGSPGDIFYTDFNRLFNPNLSWDMGGSLFASAASLGLLAADGQIDNLDALDVLRVPEPTAIVLLACAVGGLAARKSRNRKTMRHAT